MQKSTGKMLGPSEHPDQAPVCTPTVRTPQCWRLFGMPSIDCCLTLCLLKIMMWHYIANHQAITTIGMIIGMILQAVIMISEVILSSYVILCERFWGPLQRLQSSHCNMSSSFWMMMFAYPRPSDHDLNCSILIRLDMYRKNTPPAFWGWVWTAHVWTYQVRTCARILRIVCIIAAAHWLQLSHSRKDSTV